jgi:dTDP-4-amino-4,6-dideoxygalactose transaminase
LFVIEDAAQAIGAEYQGRRAGGLGTVGCFSFFPSKNLGAFGDAGIITTPDAALAAKLRALRVHGSQRKYYHQWLGGNFRIDALQAAVLRVKLRHLDRWTEARQRNAASYARLFAALGLNQKLVTPPQAAGGRHVYNQYVVRLADRSAVQTFLTEHRIGSEIYYPVPLHLQPCFRDWGNRAGECPEAERAAETTLALPTYPELTSTQQRHIVATIAAYYQSVGKLKQRRAA